MQQAIPYIRQELSGFFPEAEIRHLSNLILCHVCKMQPYQLLSHKDKHLSERERNLTKEITSRLKKHEPIQYILGETEFYGLLLEVNPQVLIPRPETEELVEWIIDNNRSAGLSGHQSQPCILDIGTGSGCIAVALAKYLPEATVYGMDISEGALETARKNADNNNVSIQWILSDILNPDFGDIPGKLDVIVSNPPYVTPPEKDDMKENVLLYEPHSALFVPAQQPLIFYEHIASAAKKLLKPDGHLYFEINAGLGRETYRMLEAFHYREIELRQDISGKDRMIKARL